MTSKTSLETYLCIFPPQITPLSEKGRKIGSTASTPFSAVAALRCDSQFATPTFPAAPASPMQVTPVVSQTRNDPVQNAPPAAAEPSSDFPAPNTLCETGPVFPAAGTSGSHVVVPPQVFFSMNTSPLAPLPADATPLSPPPVAAPAPAPATAARSPSPLPQHLQQQQAQGERRDSHSFYPSFFQLRRREERQKRENKRGGEISAREG
jgi:hypothetical protein